MFRQWAVVNAMFVKRLEIAKNLGCLFFKQRKDRPY